MNSVQILDELGILCVDLLQIQLFMQFPIDDKDKALVAEREVGKVIKRIATLCDSIAGDITCLKNKKSSKSKLNK